MLNVQCGIVCNECKCLSVRGLRKRAENRVFRPNISVVEKKCVVLAIDCCLFSECFKPASLALFLFRSARLPSLALPSGSFRSLAFRFQFFHAPFPILSFSIPCSSGSFVPFRLLRWELLSSGLVTPAFPLFHLCLEELLEGFSVVK